MAADEKEKKEKEGDEEGQESAAQPKKSGGSKKLILILAGAILLVVIVGVSAYVAYTVVNKSGGESVAVPGSQGGIAGANADKPALKTFDMEKFVIILEDESGRTHNVKMHIFFAYDDDKVSASLVERKIEITSKINLLLLSQSVTDLRSPSGRTDLINQILKLVNDSLPYGMKIKDVYFKEYIVQ